MYARWNFEKADGWLSAVWATRCEICNCSPDAVYKIAKVVLDEKSTNLWKILSDDGLRLMTCSSQCLDFVHVYKEKRKTLGDFL